MNPPVVLFYDIHLQLQPNDRKVFSKSPTFTISKSLAGQFASKLTLFLVDTFRKLSEQKKKNFGLFFLFPAEHMYLQNMIFIVLSKSLKNNLANLKDRLPNLLANLKKMSKNSISAPGIYKIEVTCIEVFVPSTF